PLDGKGAWTPGQDKAGASPDLLAGLAGAFEKLRAKAEPLARGQMPEAVRDLLGRLGSLDGLAGGLAKPFGQPVPQPLPPGARFEERLYADANGERAYKVYVPSGYDGQPLPLVVMLHGCTQSPDDFAAGTQMNQLAEERNVLVAYPAQAQSANAQKCWNWFNAADQKRGSGEPALIAGITRQIMRDFAVDPARVYAAGLSAGGAAAAIMGATYPDLYAAIGIHSGLACGAARDMPSAFAAMRQGGAAAAPAGKGASGRRVRVIVFHGDQDKTVNPVNGDQVMAQFKDSEARAGDVMRGQSQGGLAYTRNVQADPDGTPVFEQWLIHGAAHAWSGGSSNGSYTEPRGPDASREMLRFFLDHGHDKAPAAPAQGT
ncbi:MAG TPA: PHB depolymerase family esterase, partial [Enterovirga sp.]|nr:PHB depolymerase family esterase [Enterovirga sp.]